MQPAQAMDYYQLLGVSKNATFDQIKQAFRREALNCHPDRGGSTDAMQALNRAYQVLSNAEQRAQFDCDHLFQETSASWAKNSASADYERLDLGGVSFSERFRQLHQEGLVTFSNQPLERGSARIFLSAVNRESPYPEGSSLFEYIAICARRPVHSTESLSIKPLEGPLTLDRALALLKDFLSGHYYGNRLDRLLAYWTKSQQVVDCLDADFYSALYDLFLLGQEAVTRPPRPLDLICVVERLTKVFFTFSDQTLPLAWTDIFQSDGYRYLFRQALKALWSHPSVLVQALSLNTWYNTQPRQNTLRQAQDQLKGHPNAAALMRCLKLLCDFEHPVNRGDHCTTAALREMAYLMLDWIPAFVGRLPGAVLMNIFAQAGVYLQRASQQERQPAVQMADEQLAERLYQISFQLAARQTPDVELERGIHLLQCLVQFRYSHPDLSFFIPALQRRLLELTDAFPLYPTPQPCTRAFLNSAQRLLPMRAYLHQLMAGLEGDEAADWDLPEACIRYYAYEACLRNWYADFVSPETEHRFRLDLMAVLLFDYGWDFHDVQANVRLAVNRDTAGWIVSCSPLSVSKRASSSEPSAGRMEDSSQESLLARLRRFFTVQLTSSRSAVVTPIIQTSSDVFQALYGMTVDFQRAEVTFHAVPVESDTPDCYRALTVIDVLEMIEKNFGGVIFSLDPVDSMMQYHPFQTMRFLPARLHRTHYGEILLFADYLLKFLTTGIEVQGNYPFDRRSLTGLNRYLPLYLRRIIDDFQTATHPTDELLHRFWIEAESIPVFEDRSSFEQRQLLHIYAHDIKMVIKKHRLIRDAEGQLVDDPDELAEGWSIYVLDQLQRLRLAGGHLDIQAPALLFFLKQDQTLSSALEWVESGTRSEAHLPDKETAFIQALLKVPREANGKVSSRAAELLYLITRRVCSVLGKATHFSPEYVFAQEFTRHYDEFALYFPVFYQLKVFARVMILVRYLNGVRAANQAQVAQLKAALTSIQEWYDRDQKALPVSNPFRADYEAACEQQSQDLITLFKKLNEQGDVLRSRRRDQLREVQQQINHKHMSIENGASDLQRLFPSASLNDIFRFLDGSIEPLANSIAKDDFNELKRMFYQTQWKDRLSFNEMECALKGERSVIKKIARRLVDEGFSAALTTLKHDIEQRCDRCHALEQTLQRIGLGSQEKDIDLADACLWVPASIHCGSDSLLSSNRTRFVYGGVSLQPKIVSVSQPPSTGPSVHITARDLANATQRSASASAASSAGGSRGGSAPPPAAGGSGGNRGGGGWRPPTPPPSSRFVLLVDRVSKAEARALLDRGGHGLTEFQVKSIKRKLKKAGNVKVSIKYMDVSGYVRVFFARPGYTDGYQRLSFSFDQRGVTQKMIQTAFDDDHKLVHQRPGVAKNNLFDVKYARKPSE